MNPNNDYIVAKGITHKGRAYKRGDRFPAASLNIDAKSFGSLVRHGALVKAAEIKTETAAKRDEYEKMSRRELNRVADELGLGIPSGTTRADLLAAIRQRSA